MTLKSAWLASLIATITCTFSLAAWAQDDEDTRATHKLTADEQKQTVAQAAELLKEIHPMETKHPERSDWTVLEQEKNTVRWGRFFLAGEVSALVNVTPPGEEGDRAQQYSDPPPHYLSYFVWTKGKWEFRQFLGNTYDLEVHYRLDHPAVFLQGSCEFGPHDGDYKSWFLDEKTGLLVRTNFEDWGPFYLKGNYLMRQRGFERLAHDETVWIYPYKNGKMGGLLARYHTTDNGESDMIFPKETGGGWQGWAFRPVQEFEPPVTVTVVEARTAAKVEDLLDQMDPPGKKGRIDDDVSSENLFTILTGLDRSLIEKGWVDKLPPQQKEMPTSAEVTGASEIVRRLQGPLARFRLKQEQRVVVTVQDIVPGKDVSSVSKIHRGDIRGMWGRIFGGPQVQALVATGMAREEGTGNDLAELFFLQWDGSWKLQQRVGEVSGNINGDGSTDWTIKRHGSPPRYYVLGWQDKNRNGVCDAWLYDPDMQKLVPTGWTEPGIPSLSGETITFSSYDQSAREVQELHTIFQFTGTVGPPIGSIRLGYGYGYGYGATPQLDATITVRDEHAGMDVTWRLRKLGTGYHPQADLYSLSRDDGASPKEFHEDATLEFDWGGSDYSQGQSAARFVWSQLTGTGANTFQGIWDANEPAPSIQPKTVKVTGLPEAVERFTWPQPEK